MCFSQVAMQCKAFATTEVLRVEAPITLARSTLRWQRTGEEVRKDDVQRKSVLRKLSAGPVSLAGIGRAYGTMI